MDFTRSTVRSASDDSCGDYYPSGDTYDDEENLECSTGGASGETSEGGADDGDGSGDADDVAEGCLRRPVAAKDFLGKEFATEEDAYTAYKEFAKLRGFGVRKGDVARVNGHSAWRVRTIVDEHNHELAPPVFARLLPSHRKMSEGEKAQVDSLKQFGIATSKIMAYMAEQSGGYGMLRFTKWDVYNYVHRQRVARILDGDAAATISYLEGKANADMRSVARYTRTPDNRLGSLFWADDEMMMDYQLFGDVLAFDSTYRSNKYKKPLVVFSGSNYHKQTTIFGFALLEDEEVRTYRWVLLNLLDVMAQKKPCVVVTDGDKVMRTAIAEVMPTATHRLCGWHLEKNCVQRVKEAEFRKVFRNAIYANFEIREFEEYWKASMHGVAWHR
ncbi:protein FAR1-RELATED SEQUENCE 5-like [Arachis stenosperma]|uniref:protein FAR1-RELATED SEQUENCE 5-like n=1 Tax=Arachis stenosperma TaxID=217475 RepID=UPI0025AC443B|nr:protein FAR1-RELATED SEQUENCE 5-like [Arachis stenosperma]